MCSLFIRNLDEGEDNNNGGPVKNTCFSKWARDIAGWWNTFWAWFQSSEAQLDRIGDRIRGGESDRDLVWDLPWNVQEAVSDMHNTTPLSPSLSLSLVHLRMAIVMKSCLAEDKNGWWCNHSLSNSDFNFARFLSNYFFSCSIDIRCSFFLWTGFPALHTIQMFAGYVKCIPNAAHSLSSMAMLYIQTLRWRWFRPSNWNLTMHRTWAIASIYSCREHPMPGQYF